MFVRCSCTEVGGAWMRSRHDSDDSQTTHYVDAARHRYCIKTTGHDVIVKGRTDVRHCESLKRLSQQSGRCSINWPFLGSHRSSWRVDGSSYQSGHRFIKHRYRPEATGTAHKPQAQPQSHRHRYRHHTTSLATCINRARPVRRSRTSSVMALCTDCRSQYPQR